MDSDPNEGPRKKEQSIIMSKKDFSLIKEEELIEYVSSYFDKVNSVNILDEDLNYDEDMVRALAEKTGLNIGIIDKRVGRIVLEYDDALNVHILKNYFYNVSNHDIGYIDNYTHDKKYEDFSSR